jgi:predicted permease
MPAYYFKYSLVFCFTVPRKAPLLPAHAVGTVARFGFHVLIISLIYSTIARAVTVDSITEYWFVVVAAFFVLGVSYATASILHYYCKCLRISNPRDFYALRVAVTFPNIVALPILIFPSLCEYAVVYDAFGGTTSTIDIDTDVPMKSTSELIQSCEDQSTAMIFCYFFSWSLAFWSVGAPQLLKAANMKAATTNTNIETNTNTTNQAPNIASSTAVAASIDPDQATHPSSKKDEGGNVDESNNDATSDAFSKVLWNAIKQTVTSPGFVAMIAGFLTACIPPLQRAMFEPGGALRFLGAALETLGQASSPISTMVVAASLVPLPITPATPDPPDNVNDNSEEIVIRRSETRTIESPDELHDEPPQQAAQEGQEPVESPIMSDPNFGPYQPPIQQNPHQPYRRRLSRAVGASSRRLLQAATQSTPEMRRLHVWFVLSRLVISPALVVAAIVGLDCSSNVLSSVPPLAKLVVIVNASLPGALVVVVLLKSNPDLAETASAVAKVYLPSYLLSIVTISAWTAAGLWITIPDDEGRTFCQR